MEKEANRTPGSCFTYKTAPAVSGRRYTHSLRSFTPNSGETDIYFFYFFTAACNGQNFIGTSNSSAMNHLLFGKTALRCTSIGPIPGSIPLKYIQDAKKPEPVIAGTSNERDRLKRQQWPVLFDRPGAHTCRVTHIRFWAFCAKTITSLHVGLQRVPNIC